MKFTIVKPDGVVGIDGIFLPLDLSDLPVNLRAVQWDSLSGTGHIERFGDQNESISSIAPWQYVIDRWNAEKAIIDAMAADPYYGMNPVEKLAAVKEVQRKEIREAFAVAEELPASALGFTWNGGFESALKIDGAKRMAETAGLTEVHLWDSANQMHVLNMADATMVTLLVSQDYQEKFAKKQGYMNAIDAATTAEEVAAIVWE